jgi:FkbM family methyltransferase
MKILKKILARFDIGVTSNENLCNLKKAKRYQVLVDVLLHCPECNYKKVINLMEESTSQEYQDLIVLILSGFKENGFFIEFGAVDGIYLSNTYLLEKKFNWKGILSEPCKKSNLYLKSNRSCFINHDCVWSETGEKITFLETENNILSTVASISDCDAWKNKRKRGEKYDVSTIALNDLLASGNAPYTVDFLSVDTEGSEFEILKEFDFEMYNIRYILVEHNNSQAKNSLHALLLSKGYKHILNNISKIESWYEKKDKPE